MGPLEVQAEVALLHPCGDPPPAAERYFIVEVIGGERQRLPFRFRTADQANAFIATPELVENQLKTLQLLESETEEVKTLQQKLVDRERHLGYMRNLLMYPFGYQNFIQEEVTLNG